MLPLFRSLQMFQLVRPAMHFGVAMTPDAQLAVLARETQWELDEAAFELGGGRYTSDQRRKLADRLFGLAEALRGDLDKPLIIDAS
ncbi:hypothetical protein A8926_2032 [Saccharopolyspora spinosa]|uniref:Uncharacterized protein n=3 Tax=Saccharopolyspora spinosa TaxID=60894 RepID=A0A2N3XUT8_SACSN|nr:hypothetical protein A8926_2032 [Saccharopolyspora spinosa]